MYRPRLQDSINISSFRFPKYFHCHITKEILYAYIIKILHLTLSMFLHYPVKSENYNCC